MLNNMAVMPSPSPHADNALAGRAGGVVEVVVVHVVPSHHRTVPVPSGYHPGAGMPDPLALAEFGAGGPTCEADADAVEGVIRAVDGFDPVPLEPC